MTLIPTPRTDKNGNTVIRHMKPEAVSSSARKPIPAVSSVTQQPHQSSAEVGLDNKQIISIVNRIPHIKHDVAVDENLLNLMRDCGEENFARASEYLTKGTEQARDMAKKAFGFSIEDFANATADPDDPYGEDKAEHYVGGALESQVAMSWTVGNVADEIGYTDNVSALKGSVAYCNAQLNYTNRSIITDPKYWRGMVALAIADHEEKADKRDCRAFISWASERSDLAVVIQTAKERGTVKPDVLTAILDQGLAAPLQQGAL